MIPAKLARLSPISGTRHVDKWLWKRSYQSLAWRQVLTGKRRKKTTLRVSQSFLFRRGGTPKNLQISKIHRLRKALLMVFLDIVCSSRWRSWQHDNTSCLKKTVYHPPSWNNPIWVITLVIQLTVILWRETHSLLHQQPQHEVIYILRPSLPESIWVFHFSTPLSFHNPQTDEIAKEEATRPIIVPHNINKCYC